MFAVECLSYYHLLPRVYNKNFYYELLLLPLQIAGYSLSCALISATTPLLTVNHFTIHYNTSPHHIQYKSFSYNSDIIASGAVLRGMLVIKYSPGGRLIAIAVNNRKLSQSKILFLSPNCDITTSVSPYNGSYEHGRYRLLIQCVCVPYELGVCHDGVVICSVYIH